MKTEPPSGEVALFQSGVSQQSRGWNKTEVSSTVGHFLIAANQSLTPNKLHHIHLQRQTISDLMRQVN